MSGRQWARSGEKSSTHSGVSRPRPAGSWDAALDRARREWDGLTGGPAMYERPEGNIGRGDYSEVAAAAILRLAVALWPAVAAEMAEGLGDD